MSKEQFPFILKQMAPEVEECCGSLCDKRILIEQIQAIILKNKLLELALSEVEPHHELLGKNNEDSEGT